jgi:glucose/mannose transport system substrate-binding protein
LANVDVVAVREGWDALLPSAISDLVKYKNSYVAVPINVHRNNWLWINMAVLKRAGASVPTTWDQFFEAADLIKKTGFIALAHGGQPWQDLLLFENVALGIGGIDFYRKALVELDPDQLASTRMLQVLQTFRRLKAYTKPTPQGLDWIQASNSVARGEAGMQMMGDWAKPIFDQVNGPNMPDFECVPTPGSQKSFLFMTDSFVLFKVKGAENIKAQQDFASALLSVEVQEEFNMNKGSIPVRLGMDLSRFDRCGKMSGIAFQAAARTKTLVPSLAIAVSPAVEEAMVGIISDHWRDSRITPLQTVQRLVAAVHAPILSGSLMKRQ